MRLEIVALSTMPEVHRGDDVGALIRDAARKEHHFIDPSVIVAVAQKIVSKAEGAVIDLRSIQPSPFARSWAAEWSKDARLVELILSESKRIVKMDRGILISETRLGYVCANAGVDQSNVASDDFASVLPRDPDGSAMRLREQLGCGAVIITDTFGRPWREGLVDVTIGLAGLSALDDLRGTVDRRGRKLSGTIIAVADQLAAAAGILMRKSAGSPVVIVRGFEWKPAAGSAQELIRSPEQDLFR
ncbi:MAG TPA: coenzyme F420-0:L-glutamate ligase [Candidatus Acidoferrales bacterium]|jgi:coenzyme F420-0:L-glutamate ligase/coenzyme F420-1:gamma-L-glutamate ligase|nr:coenzyme F420-0:L-glutamate ligase [Candidatus Acidoferrales bacterium]